MRGQAVSLIALGIVIIIAVPALVFLNRMDGGGTVSPAAQEIDSVGGQTGHSTAPPIVFERVPDNERPVVSAAPGASLSVVAGEGTKDQKTQTGFQAAGPGASFLPIPLLYPSEPATPLFNSPLLGHQWRFSGF